MSSFYLRLLALASLSSRSLIFQQLCNSYDSFSLATFSAFYLTPVILRLPLWVSGVQQEERLNLNSEVL